MRPWIVKSPSGGVANVQAKNPHQAAVKAAEEFGVTGLVSNPKVTDYQQPQWSVRTPKASLPCWWFVVR